jgi:retinol dehydrogenase-12
MFYLVFNLWFAQSLTSHLPPTSPLIINSVNPGLCYSSLRRDWPLLGLPIMKIMELLLCRTAVDGAKTYIWAALSGKNDVAVRENLRGAYTSACRIEEPSDYVMSQEGQKARDQVWVRTLLNCVFRRLRSLTKFC